VDREEALRRLPEAHAKALRLRDQGVDDATLADNLDIPFAALGPLIRIAEAKLARLRMEDPADPPPFRAED